MNKCGLPLDQSILDSEHMNIKYLNINYSH